MRKKDIASMPLLAPLQQVLELFFVRARLLFHPQCRRLFPPAAAQRDELGPT